MSAIDPEKLREGWQPIETAPKGEDCLLFHPALYRRGQNTHGAWMRIGRVGDTPNRIPTHWHILPRPPTAA